MRGKIKMCNSCEEVYCYHCNKSFYCHGFRMKEAKTVSCFYCGRRIIKSKIKEI